MFTGSLGASFGFVILLSLLLSLVAQLNIWRVLCYAGLRGQDAANRLLNGLGYALAALIALGGAAKLLVLVSALNGLILPLTLGVCLIVARNKRIMGEDYRHPVWLWVLGLIAALASAWVGVTSLGTLADLFK